jgi:plastocyanin
MQRQMQGNKYAQPMRASVEMVRGGRRLRLAAALTAAAFVIGACGGDDGEGAPEQLRTSATSASGSATDATPKTDALVQMTDALRYQPAEVVLKVGGKVTWTNPSTVVHSATGDPAKVADASHVELPPGAAPWDSGLLQLHAGVHGAGHLPLHLHPPRERAGVRNHQSRRPLTRPVSSCSRVFGTRFKRGHPRNRPYVCHRT